MSNLMVQSMAYTPAKNLDDAWVNFEPDLPLPILASGGPNPYYVPRPGNPTARLEKTLLRSFSSAPKLFFSGHRGCGKSTELLRVAVNPDIVKKYYPIHFSIRDEGDVNDIDYKDVLFAIARKLYQVYGGLGFDISSELRTELESWKGTWTEEVTRSGRFADLEIELGVPTWIEAAYGKLGAKLKVEPATRTIVRHVLERNITRLLSVIDVLTASIVAATGRFPLILIDDLDKIDDDAAKNMFYAHSQIMLQPACSLVYTVSSSLFYTPEFIGIRDRAYFLPNIKMRDRQTKETYADGYRTMRDCVLRRLAPDQAAPDALSEAARVSGGVFRELARVMRAAISRAGDQGPITREHVLAAEREIRGEYRRILTRNNRDFLRHVQRAARQVDPAEAADLLRILAILEYANGDDEPWWDVHPSLDDLLKEPEIDA